MTVNSTTSSATTTTTATTETSPMKRKLTEFLEADDKEETAGVWGNELDSDDSYDSDSSEGDDDLSDDEETYDSAWKNGMGMTMVPKRVWSTPTLSRLLCFQEVQTNLQKRIRKSESAIFPSAQSAQCVGLDPTQQIPQVNSKKPEECLKDYLTSQKLTLDMISTNADSFLKVSDQNLTCYPEVAHAARSGNLSALKAMLEEGSPLQCTNNYGESVVHIVCRRGSKPMLEFLMNEAKVSIRVRDDVGRTCLHDAVWTSEPNFELVNVLLADSPDLLLVRDKRGHSALAYIPRTNWAKWCTFLESHHELIRSALDSKNTIISKKDE